MGDVTVSDAQDATLDVEVTANRLELSGTAYACVFVRDMRGRRQLEERLQGMTSDLQSGCRHLLHG